MKNYLSGLFLILLFASCASKKNIHYLQNIERISGTEINYGSAKIQPNDILYITVGSTTPEAAIPYNKTLAGNQQPMPEMLRLTGYLVTLDHTINFPVLGTLSTKNKTTLEFEQFLLKQLVEGGHLKNANVTVRLVNAKFTVLGEVNQPGTYTFTEQNITILQALGYAGDLTINGKRDDIILTRETSGIRQVTHIDLTNADFMNSEFYFIQPNDMIIVNQNEPRVKEAGFVGDIGTVLTIASLALSVTILLTR